MKIKILSTFFTILLLLSSFFVSASSINTQNNNTNSCSLDDAELPTWEVGHFWKYNMGFDFISREGGKQQFSVEAEISDMYATVTYIAIKGNDEFYVLTVDGWIEGVLSIFESEWEVADFEGDFGGTADINKNTLGITEFNFEVNGQADIPLLGWRDMYFCMTMTFNPGFDFFGFPIIAGEDPWDVYIEEAELTAYVNVDCPFGQHDYTGSMAFSDVMSIDRLDVYTLGSQNYDCYVLTGTWGYESELWYSSDLGYLAKVHEALDWEDGSVETVFDLDLLDTNFDINNGPPDPPTKPSGPTECEIEMDYTFTTQTTDPQGDQVYYWFEWGDETNSGWIGPYNSGATASATHRWYSKGVYSIVVKAKDESGIESGWSEPLSVTILGDPKVTLLMHRIEKKDEVEWPSNPHEWYYMCHVKSEQMGSPEQYNYDTDDGTYDGEWYSRDNWQPDKEHEFLGSSRLVTVKIKLMEYDGGWEGFYDDLADVSGCNYPDNDGYEDDTPDKRGAIYHGTYDIVTEKLKDYSPNPNDNADKVYKEDGYYYTCGYYEPDNTTGYENGINDPENDALVMFRLSNDYKPPQAYAQCLEPPEKRRPYEPLLFTGSVREGKPSYSWHWNFGDGGTSDEQSPVHIFENLGTYNVKLTVTDEFEQTSSYSIQVTLRNYDPILTNDKVEWTGSGTSLDTFTFTVRYIDHDLDDPSVKKVFIDGEGKTLKGQGSNSDYTLDLRGSVIGAGNHNYYFYFEDGHGGSAQTKVKSFSVTKGRPISSDKFNLLANLLDRFPFLMRLLRLSNFGS